MVGIANLYLIDNYYVEPEEKKPAHFQKLAIDKKSTILVQSS